MRKKESKLGKMVEVIWKDAASGIVEDNINWMNVEQLFAEQHTYGKLEYLDEKNCVVITNRSMSNGGEVDYTAIPASWIKRIKVYDRKSRS